MSDAVETLTGLRALVTLLASRIDEALAEHARREALRLAGTDLRAMKPRAALLTVLAGGPLKTPQIVERLTLAGRPTTEDGVAAMCSRLAKSGEVERLGHGRYGLPAKAAEGGS